jgi:hypothetical protein
VQDSTKEVRINRLLKMFEMTGIVINCKNVVVGNKKSVRKSESNDPFSMHGYRFP